jgi:hypothetical protein
VFKNFRRTFRFCKLSNNKSNSYVYIGEELENNIELAIKNGAFAIIVEENFPIIDNEIAWIKVKNIEDTIIKLIRYLIKETGFGKLNTLDPIKDSKSEEAPSLVSTLLFGLSIIGVILFSLILHLGHLFRFDKKFLGITKNS